MADNPNTAMFLGLPRITLSFFGVWMLPHRNVFYKIITTIIAIVQISFLLFNLTFMVLVWGDVDEMSEGSYLLFTHIALMCKTSNFVFRKDKFQQLLETMGENVFASQFEKHYEIFFKHSKSVRMIYKFLFLASWMNCLEWIVVPLVDMSQRLFPFHVWMPGNVQASPNYEFWYAYQVVFAITSANVFLALDAVFVSMIMFACAQFEIIMVNIQMIERLPTGISPNDKMEMINRNTQVLMDCIMHHQAIIRFLNQVKNMFHIAVFIQMSGTIMIICVVGFRITVEPPNTVHFYSTLNYLIVMLAQLYLYCWCGNELTTKNEQLRDCLYACPWHEQNKKFGRILCIAMECNLRPLFFIAGQFITLSRPTFVSILRCSYSYYAILSQSHGKTEENKINLE